MEGLKQYVFTVNIEITFILNSERCLRKLWQHFLYTIMSLSNKNTVKRSRFF